MKTFSKNIRLAVLTTIIALSLLLSACDNGGTINPDAGCIGQGSGWDSCMETLEGIGQ